MARVRSTSRVSREGDETEAAETVLISELMERSGLVVTEEVVDGGAPDAEAEQTIAEEENCWSLVLKCYGLRTSQHKC
jgi:nucleotide-binding universal stress UspA family protein